MATRIYYETAIKLIMAFRQNSRCLHTNVKDPHKYFVEITNVNLNVRQYVYNVGKHATNECPFFKFISLLILKQQFYLLN